MTAQRMELQERRRGSGKWRSTSWEYLQRLLPSSRYREQGVEWVQRQLELGAALDFGDIHIRRRPW